MMIYSRSEFNAVLAARGVVIPAERSRVRPILLWSMIALLVWSYSLRMGAPRFANSFMQQQVVYAHASPAPKAKPTKAPDGGSGTNLASSAGGVANCQRDTDYRLPTSVTLINAPAGLSTQLDQPSHYRVYGNDSHEVTTQMATCAPVLAGDLQAEYASMTGYNLTWKYDYSVDSNQQCTISNVKVGLHINMVLPDWQPIGATDFAAKWHNFIGSLTTHENGHVLIDKQYAALLLSDLQHQPPSDCQTFSETVKSLAEYDVAKLNQANDAYDAETIHGATQGAVLR